MYVAATAYSQALLKEFSVNSCVVLSVASGISYAAGGSLRTG